MPFLPSPHFIPVFQLCRDTEKKIKGREKSEAGGVFLPFQTSSCAPGWDTSDLSIQRFFQSNSTKTWTALNRSPLPADSPPPSQLFVFADQKLTCSWESTSDSTPTPQKKTFLYSHKAVTTKYWGGAGLEESKTNSQQTAVSTESCCLNNQVPQTCSATPRAI